MPNQLTISPSFGTSIDLCVRYTAAFVRRAWWLVPVPAIPDLVFDLAQIHGLFPQQNYPQVRLSQLAISSFIGVMATYWSIRFLVLGQSVSAALSVNRETISTFVPYLAVFSVFWFVMALLRDQGPPVVLVLVWLTTLCFESLFAAWSVASPSGAKSIGPVVALRHGRKHLIWGACLLAVVQTPFDIATEGLQSVGNAFSGHVWLQSVTLVSIALISSISLIAFCAALLVIASRAGVRVNSSPGIKDIFA